MNATTPVTSNDFPRVPASGRGRVPQLSWNAGSQPQQAGLFEQLLSFSAPPVREPPPTAETPPPGPEADKEPSHSDNSAPTERDESPRQEQDEEQLEAAPVDAAAFATQPSLPVDQNAAEKAVELESGGVKDANDDLVAEAAAPSVLPASQHQATSEQAAPTQVTSSHVEPSSDAPATAASQANTATEELTPGAEQPVTANLEPHAKLAAAETDVLPAETGRTPEMIEAKASDVELATQSDVVVTGQAPAHGTEASDDHKQGTNRRADRPAHSQRSKWYEQDAQGKHPVEQGRGADSGSAVAEPSHTATELSAASLENTASGQTAQAAAAEMAIAPDLSAVANQPPASVELQVAALGPDLQVSHSAGNSPSVVSGEIGSVTATESTVRGDGSSRQAGAEYRAENQTRSTSAATDASTPLDQQETVRLIQRVARSFNRLGPMGGEVNLRLHPPELGSLNVQVRLEGRSMTAKLTAETSAAREVILENLPILKSRLAEQGIDVALFQVDVADNGSADAGLGSGNHQAFEQQGERQPTQYQPPVHRFVSPSSNAEPELGEPAVKLLGNSTYGIDVHA